MLVMNGNINDIKNVRYLVNVISLITYYDTRYLIHLGMTN